jgi:SnoaL-like domain
VIDDEQLLTMVHDSGIRRLQAAYADVCNRRAWAELEDLFLPDTALVVDQRSKDELRFTGAAEAGAFIGTSVDQFEFFEFVVLNAHIVFPDGPSDGSAVGRMFMCEHRQDRIAGRWTDIYGVYHDRYALVEGRWWFAERCYHSLARDARDADVFAFPEPTPFEVPGYRG